MDGLPWIPAVCFGSFDMVKLADLHRSSVNGISAKLDEGSVGELFYLFEDSEGHCFSH